MLPIHLRRHCLPRFFPLHSLSTFGAQPVSSAAAAAATLATSSHVQFAHGKAAEQHGLPLDSPSYLIWGANTGVGKTLVSVGLAHAAQRLKIPFLYLKPVQTGFPADSDARLVAQASGAQLLLGAHAAEQAASAAALSSSNSACSSGTAYNTIGSMSSSLEAASHPAPSASDAGQSRHARVGDCDGTEGTEAGAILQVCRVEHAWGAPVSPHVAVQQEGRPVADGALCDSVTRHMRVFHNQLTVSSNSSSRTSSGAWPSSQANHQNGEWQLPPEQGQDGAPMSLTSGPEEQELQRLAAQGMMLVESAGGVASPSPSGRLMVCLG
ncbi:AAA domain-containing protein [Dunaliella salina]|uniref:AAA domain-containing protein n=1 Tax=Dunaliella salina TaxID=3046 RepID=A0ABQ7FXE4_DUNSA|nr:AAA domain-containing protein [Dunaliella salina]|eukprot:KAF5827030.1 AAA domain-containing protein [Dunaliella salina]